MSLPSDGGDVGHAGGAPNIGSIGRGGSPLLDQDGRLLGCLLPPSGVEGVHGQTVAAERLEHQWRFCPKGWSSAAQQFEAASTSPIQPGTLVWSLEVWGDVTYGLVGTLTEVREGFMALFGADCLPGAPLAPRLLAEGSWAGEVDDAWGDGTWHCLSFPGRPVGGEFLRTPVGHFGRLGVVPRSTEFSVKWPRTEFSSLAFHVSRWWPTGSPALSWAIESALEPLEVMEGSAWPPGVRVEVHGPGGRRLAWQPPVDRVALAGGVAAWVRDTAEAWRTEVTPEQLETIEVIVDLDPK